MQLLLQAGPLIDKLKHWQRAISFNEVQLTTTQKVIYFRKSIFCVCTFDFIQTS